MRKHPKRVLLPFLLAALFLLNTLTVMAIGPDEMPPAEPPAVTEPVTDSSQPSALDKVTPELEKTPDAGPLDDSKGGTEPPVDIVWVEVGTYEQLYEALEASTLSETARIRLTSNITVPSNEEYNSALDHPIELDLGPYSLYVEGLLTLQSGLTLTGSPGEDALIRVRSGGLLHIRDVEIQAGDRYAVWQEEGAAFTFSPMPDFSGKIHFADKDVAIPHSFISWKVAMPVAVVHDGQTLADVLPDTDSVHLFRNNGTDEPEYDIAVDWDVDAYQAELNTRTRTIITGRYPDAIALQQPICLVVFQNGNPASFLDAYGMESYGQPKAKVKIKLMEPELGCRFEWSQDGENWLSADAVETPSWDGRLAFTVSFPQETPPVYPYYLSAVVDYLDGRTGYSDLLVIESADSQCDSGGNRHGGIGVTPPALPPLGGIKDDDMDGVAPEEPDYSSEPDGSEPPNDGVTEEPNGTQPPVVNPPVEPVIETPNSPLATNPTAAVEPASPLAGQARDGVTASTPTIAQAKPSPSASTRKPDATLFPEPQTTADVQETLTPVVTEAETPIQDGGPPNKKTVGVIATGGIITLTMTWESWSKWLVGLLRGLLKR